MYNERSAFFSKWTESNRQIGNVEDTTHLIIFCNGVLLAPADLVISAHTSSATGARQSCRSVWSTVTREENL